MIVQANIFADGRLSNAVELWIVEQIGHRSINVQANPLKQKKQLPDILNSSKKDSIIQSVDSISRDGPDCPYM